MADASPNCVLSTPSFLPTPCCSLCPDDKLEDWSSIVEDLSNLYMNTFWGMLQVNALGN